MHRYVKYRIHSYSECLLRKIPIRKHQGELHIILPGKRPFAVVNIDYIGHSFIRQNGICLYL